MGVEEYSTERQRRRHRGHRVFLSLNKDDYTNLRLQLTVRLYAFILRGLCAFSELSVSCFYSVFNKHN